MWRQKLRAGRAVHAPCVGTGLCLRSRDKWGGKDALTREAACAGAQARQDRAGCGCCQHAGAAGPWQSARDPHPRPVKPQYAGAGASPLRAGVLRLHTGACPGGSPKGSPLVSGSGSNQPPQSRQLVPWRRLPWRRKKTGSGGTRGAGSSQWVHGPSAVDAQGLVSSW